MRGLILAVALLTLSACAQPGGRTPGTAGKNLGTKPDASLANSAAAAPAKVKITATQLLGQNDSWVLEKMGEPGFRRADSVANMWQYKNDRCVLNVFLYADTADANAPKRVLHFDARDSSGQNTDRDECLNGLQD